jgi:XTP/dITP diphosphohydrolase
MSEIWVGTGNKGKLSEFGILFSKHLPQMKLHSSDELKSYVAPPENGTSFLENARIKARSLKSMKPGVWVFAEDSGLEVEALGNLPGIHSARYAGPKASDSENVAKLLKMMQLRAGSNRKAAFKATVVAFTPSGEEVVVTGELMGQISSTPKGQHGFGYDSVFIPDQQTQTLAELGSGFKTQNSHRAMAVLKLIEHIRSRGL